MGNRLKERLTGAAILVALIVLVVPELFHGQRASSPRPGVSSQSQAEHSVTIDLASGSTSVVSAPLPPRTSPPQSAGTPPLPLSTPPGGTAPPPRASVPATRVAAAGDGAAATSVTAGTGSGRGGEWTVQLGLFAKSANAQRLLASAHAKGFPARLSRSGSRGWYRVAIAGLSDRTAAVRLSQKLRAAGLPAAVVRGQ